MSGAPPRPPEPPAPPGEATALPTATARAFGRRTVIWLSIAGALSLLATLLLPVLVDDNTPSRQTRGANAYSFSAVGHHAFVRFLRAIELPVVVSRHHSGRKAGPRRPLIIAEPSDYEDEALREMIEDALEKRAPVVVVLPKWELSFFEDPLPDQRPALVPATEVARVLEIVSEVAEEPTSSEQLAGAVLRPSSARRWAGAIEPRGGLSLARPQLVDGQALHLRALLWLDEALGGEDAWPMLIGCFEDIDLYVVSDPGLFDTMGLSRGDNALIIYHFLVDTLGAQGVILDEVVHGYKRADSIWSELFEFPLILLTFHLLGLLVLALWAAMGRFGAPATPPPRIPAGKATLIDNTAALLALGGHMGYSLGEYLKATIRALARTYALPTGLTDAERVETLGRLAREQDTDDELDELCARVAKIRDHRHDTRRALQLARRIYRFRKEMMHGHRGD